MNLSSPPTSTKGIFTTISSLTTSIWQQGNAISPTKEATTKSAIKAINSAKRITSLSLTNTTKDLRKSIRRTASLGMKMSKLRREILGKVGSNLTLTG